MATVVCFFMFFVLSVKINSLFRDTKHLLLKLDHSVLDHCGSHCSFVSMLKDTDGPTVLFLRLITEQV